MFLHFPYSLKKSTPARSVRLDVVEYADRRHEGLEGKKSEVVTCG